jgi:hypothetical protein
MNIVYNLIKRVKHELQFVKSDKFFHKEMDGAEGCHNKPSRSFQSSDGVKPILSI